MKNKSSKLILGIVLLVIAIVVWLTDLTSYWVSIALAAIGLILIISDSSSPSFEEKKEAPLETKEEELIEKENVMESSPDEEGSEEVEEGEEGEEEKKNF
ncbi:hypothetical protein K9K85_02375 [Patescibacteria group bacterium]|nr:hypothetical protein [Patescibacteria group bacterium]